MLEEKVYKQVYNVGQCKRQISKTGQAILRRNKCRRALADLRLPSYKCIVEPFMSQLLPFWITNLLQSKFLA